MDTPEILDLKPVKKVYSRIGWSLCLILASLLAVQALLSWLLQTFWPDGCWLTESPYGKWLLTFVPQYLIAMPAGIMLMRSLPKDAPAPARLGGKDFWTVIAIAFFLTYAGNIVGNLLSSLLSGGNAENALDQFALDPNPIKILFMVVLAPLFEELVFRKLIIDRTRRFGEQTAVFISALTFGLFHTNLFQFFYAFLVGWLFAYVYIRSGRMRYCVLMHSIVNFTGGVIAPMILSMLDLDALSTMDPNADPETLLRLYAGMLPGLMAYMLYLIFMLGTSITGLVFLVQRRNRLIWQAPADPLPAKVHNKAICLNPGMLVFLILCGAMTILSVISL